jgi:hypothetical protein
MGTLSGSTKIASWIWVAGGRPTPDRLTGR